MASTAAPRWSRRTRVAVAFAAFGLVSHFVPSEPFLTPYLIDVKGFTEDEVNNQIYPVWTYAYLAFLAVIGPATEIVGYKTMIVVDALAVLTTRTILVVGTSLAAMQAMQVTYGLATAADVAFYSYIYRLVEEDDFQRVTSSTRASVLMGHVLSGVVGQLLYSFANTPLTVLFYISLGSIVVATVQSFFLPGASAELHLQPKSRNPIPPLASYSLGGALSWLGAATSSVAAIYRRPEVLAWSLWWMLAMCGLVAVEGYSSSIWYSLDPTIAYNGFVDASARLVAAAAAFLPLLLRPDTPRRRIQVLLIRGIVVVGSTICILLCVTSAVTAKLYVAYGTYILFEGTMYGMLALAAAQIARRMGDEHFAIVFGLNTFCALAIFTVLQAIISSLGLDIHERFWVYTAIFSSMTLVAVVDAGVRIVERAGWFSSPAAASYTPIDDAIVEPDTSQR